MNLVESLARVEGVESIEARHGHRLGDVAVVVEMDRLPSAQDVTRIADAIAAVVPAISRVACVITSPPGARELLASIDKAGR